MKILIVGKNSKIAKALIKYISEMHTDYLAQFDLISGRGIIDPTRFENVDAVIHVSGMSHTDKGKLKQQQIEEYFRANRDQVRRTVAYAEQAGVKHFVYLSTMMVYGNAVKIGKAFEIHKDTVANPACIYGKSKLAGEEEIQKVIHNSKCGMTASIIREPVLYGEDYPDGEWNKLFRIAEKIHFFPKIKSEKSYIYQGNLCELIYQVLLNSEVATGCKVYCPQDGEKKETYLHYCDMVGCYGNKCKLVRGVYPFVWLLCKLSGKVSNLMESITYASEMDDGIPFHYKVFTMKEAMDRIRS